jgi:hypothetical protein
MTFVYEIAPLRVYKDTEILPLLPVSFSFTSESGKSLLMVVSGTSAGDPDVVFAKVQRECDRVAFLTGEKLAPKLKRIDRPGGGTTNFKTQAGQSYTKKTFSPTRQQWTPRLAVQLRLWHLARRSDTPLAARINLLFQIIECEHPDKSDTTVYPPFTSSTTKPAALTECKLLRDLVSHGADTPPSGKQIQEYMKHLGITNFFDPSDSKHAALIGEKTRFVEGEAMRIIEAAIT